MTRNNRRPENEKLVNYSSSTPQAKDARDRVDLKIQDKIKGMEFRAAYK